MRTRPAVVLSLMLVTFISAGCSKQAPSPAPGAPAATVEAAAPAPAQHASACDLVTASEMSAILGGTVQAKAGGNERSPAATECLYQSPAAQTTGSGLDELAGTNPYAEVEVDWGGGDPEVVGTAANQVNGAAQMDAASPLKGLGDRAYTVTADQVFISTHGNLMMVRFPRRSEDVAQKARRIFETAQPRM